MHLLLSVYLNSSAVNIFHNLNFDCSLLGFVEKKILLCLHLIETLPGVTAMFLM